MGILVMGYEYKVQPAPGKGVKVKGVKTPEARFALAFEQVMNQLAGDGWEYVRSDTLPSEERQGLTGSQTVWRSVLVFRRPVEAEADVPVEPTALLPEPEPEEMRTESDDAAVDTPEESQVFEEGDEETRPA